MKINLIAADVCSRMNIKMVRKCDWANKVFPRLKCCGNFNILIQKYDKSIKNKSRLFHQHLKWTKPYLISNVWIIETEAFKCIYYVVIVIEELKKLWIWSYINEKYYRSNAWSYKECFETLWIYSLKLKTLCVQKCQKLMIQSLTLLSSYLSKVLLNL